MRRRRWLRAGRMFGCAAAVGLLACGESPRPTAPAAPPPVVETGFRFTYVPPVGAPTIRTITVAGAFNGWSTTAAPMQRQADGSWAARIPLADSRYEYKFHINGEWPADMCHDRTWGDPARQYWIDHDALGCMPDGQGGQNALIGVGVGADSPGLSFTHDPTAPAQLSVAGGRLSVRFRSYPREAQSAVVRAEGATTAMHLQSTYRMQEIWRGTLPVGATSYSITVQTAAGPREFGPFAVPTQLFREVSWVGASVGYQIFPERFSNGDPSNDRAALDTDEYQVAHPAVRGAPPILSSAWDAAVTDQHCCHQYYGGDLQGIIDRLDHLQSMGVTLLYLNPIFLAGSAHGYDTWDYFTIDPAFGTEAVARRLVDAVHARGMRIIWDFVPNHVGVGNSWFQDAIARGTASPYWPWFTFKVAAGQVQAGNGNHYVGWWGFGSLPELVTRPTAAMDTLLAAVRHWTRFGFDGIRVDVPGDIDNRDEFFQAFRSAAKSIAPETWLVGEIWQRSPEWLQGDKFDALMNYAIGQDVIERFALGQVTGGAALQSLAQLYAEYPEASSAMGFNLISSHDNARLLTKMGGGGLGATPSAAARARQQLASAMLYALPGVPVTFQGDECGQLGTGGGREENRYPVQWQSCDAATLAHYRQLGALRRDHAGLRSPAIRLYAGQGSVMAWFRGDPGAEEVLTIFNSGEQPASVPLPSGTWVDLANARTFAGSADIAGRGWSYLKRR